MVRIMEADGPTEEVSKEKRKNSYIQFSDSKKKGCSHRVKNKEKISVLLKVTGRHI